MIPYGRQFIDDDDIKNVVEVLKSDFITQGERVKDFEDKLAKTCGAKYAAVFNSGTSALFGAYYGSGLTKGDEFITSPMTFVATSNAGLYLGAKPVFVDVEHDTGNIDTDLIEMVVTEKTRLIVPVHYAGHPCDMEKIRNIADKFNLKIIEDGCHALGAKYKNHTIGNCKYSDMAVFSFHPVKHITTGEGGAVLTNIKEYYDKLIMFRNHGITKEPDKLINPPHGSWYYEMQFLGYNFRMTDIQGVLGNSQLDKLVRFIQKRRYISERYFEIFKQNPYFDLPFEKGYAFHAYHLFPIRLKDKFAHKKAEIVKNLQSKGLGVQIHYIPVYLQPYYIGLGYKQGLCENAEDFYKKEISIPIHYSMTDEHIETVAKTIFEVMKGI